VIGSHGASIDELVEPGTNGELVPIGQPAALALVRAWRREVPWTPGGFPLPSLRRQMEPEAAARNFLRLADRAGVGSTSGRASHEP
jgi:hypothetical protein